MTFPKPPEARDSTNGAPQLRKRSSGTIPATIAEEGTQNGHTVASRTPPLRTPRRASSVMTDGSSSMDDRRTSFRSSTDSLLSPPRATSHDEHVTEEPSLWYSAPLLFAIVPAIGGVAFKSGSILLTDVALLALAAVYLNWCLITPWIWYHSAQTVKLAKPAMEGPISEEAMQDDLAEDRHDQDTSPSAGEYPENAGSAVPPSTDSAKVNPAAAAPDEAAPSREASAELAMHELAALAMCVLGPFLGSYILHVIRSSLLSLHGGQLVSNMHLTLFVLGAELRPVRHCIKLVQTRTLHLQRIIRSEPHPAGEGEQDEAQALEDLSRRLADLETSAVFSAEQQQANGAAKAEPLATPDDVKRTQQALQTQIDALNRAVRRYEKRETARMVQNEERLQDIELRLREALSLSAAAAQNSQRPGLIMGLVEWAMRWARWTIEILTWPLHWMSDLGWSVLKKLGLARPIRRRKPAKRVPENARDGREREKWLKKREDGIARPSDAWLKSRR